jgi:thioredoxin reductase
MGRALSESPRNTRRRARAAEPSGAREAAFVAIGHIPNTQLFNGQLEMTENGCVIASDGL